MTGMIGGVSQAINIVRLVLGDTSLARGVCRRCILVTALVRVVRLGDTASHAGPTVATIRRTRYSSSVSLIGLSVSVKLCTRQPRHL